MEPITIAFVDDHQIVRQGLHSILDSNPLFKVVGDAASGAEALLLVERTKPQAVILDLQLNDIPGDEVCRAILKISPGTAILILTAHYDSELVRACLHAGARGYLVKDAEQINLPQQITDIVNGYAILDPRAADVLLDYNYQREEPNCILSTRELEILKLISLGLSNAEISARIFLSENTIKTHIKEIFSKLNVHNRIEAVMEAKKQRIM